MSTVSLIPAFERRKELLPLYEEYAAMLLETDPVFADSLAQQNYDEELEHLLSGLPGILEALVTGEGESRLLTAEVYSTLPEKNVNDQIDMINRSLPIYKRIRRVVVRKEPFPRTASGKIKV